jgi:CheY-like chemotaxis protein
MIFSANVKILVVEDDGDMRDILVDVAEATGASVFQAANGKSAISRLEMERFDLVVSDVQMPEMGGIELTKAIRAKTSDAPMVLLISGQTDLSEDGALAIGAAGLIHKPFSMDSLFAKMSQLLSLKASAKAG